MRAIANRARFADLCFADTGQIQPAAHLPSQSWDGAWLDPATKELRPCPGMEDVFNDSYGPKGSLRGELADLGITAAVVAPPPRRSFWSRLFGKK